VVNRFELPREYGAGDTEIMAVAGINALVASRRFIV